MMKKFEKREYSSNYLEQSKAVDQFKNKLKKDTLVELVNKLDNYKYLLSNNYHDRKMEVYEKVYLNGIKKSWLSTEERRILSSEEKLNREKQKYECELKAEREKNLEEKNLFEAVASNVDVIDLIIDEVMNKLVDLNVTEIDNLVSEKALQSLRTANGFIENSDVDVRFITYSSHYNRVIKNILEGKQLPVYGDGSNVRDWLYVEDHCKAIDMVITNGRAGEVYNVGGHNEKTNLEIVKITISTIQKMMEETPVYRKVLKKRVLGADGQIDISWINDSLITFVKDRLGHDQRYAIDPTKIKNELGWYPETCFDVGIVKTIEWYLNHQDWVEQVTSGDYQHYYEQMYSDR